MGWDCRNTTYAHCPEETITSIMGSSKLSREFFKLLHILTVPSLYAFEILKQAMKNFEAFENKIEGHQHNTRRKNILQPLQNKLKVSQKGIHLWDQNSLTSHQ